MTNWQIWMAGGHIGHLTFRTVTLSPTSSLNGAYWFGSGRTAF